VTAESHNARRKIPMMRTGPAFLTERSECPRPSDLRVSYRNEKLGGSFAKDEDVFKNVLDETINSKSKSFEWPMWDIEITATNHQFTLGKIDDSEMNFISDIGSQQHVLTVSPTTDIESHDAFDCFESLESPRVDAEEVRGTTSSMAREKNQYRAWVGARGLHIH
jgi:hypothetical protein